MARMAPLVIMEHSQKIRREDDAAKLPPIPVQRSAPVAERGRLQLGESMATTAGAGEDWKLVAHEFAATAGENRRTFAQARPVLLVAAGRE